MLNFVFFFYERGDSSDNIVEESRRCATNVAEVPHQHCIKFIPKFDSKDTCFYKVGSRIYSRQYVKTSMGPIFKYYDEEKCCHNVEKSLPWSRNEGVCKQLWLAKLIYLFLSFPGPFLSGPIFARTVEVHES